MSNIRLSNLRGVGGKDINLDGPTSVLPNTSNVYNITDYDSFSVYTVTTNVGTISIAEDVVTLTIPPATPDGIVNMRVARNGVQRLFSVAVDSSSTGLIVTPTIISPSNGSTDVSTSVAIQASPFATIPVGGVFVSSRWQVARDAAFTDIVTDTVLTTGDKTRYNPSSLVVNTTYYVRVSYTDAVQTSPWSAVVSFATSSVMISKPTISILGTQSDVGEAPTFNSSAFVAVPAGSDSHISSTWVLRKTSDNSVVWQNLNSTGNKLSQTVPRGILSNSTSYSMEVQYNGSLGQSMFSDKLTFVTAASFVPDTPGAPFGGGYYVGKINVDDGKQYALVVAPASLGGQNTSGLVWKTSNTQTSGTSSLNNGWNNTQAMVTAGISAHPAGNFCKNLTIGGYNDWYLPSADELEMLYRAYKPDGTSNYVNASGHPHGANGVNLSSVPPGAAYTSNNPAITSVTAFLTGGAEAFSVGNYYWTSSEYAPSPAGYAWYQYFSSGLQLGHNKTLASYVRGVRRVLLG